jgi:DNA-binding transcriptional regulator YiaG
LNSRDCNWLRNICSCVCNISYNNCIDNTYGSSHASLMLPSARLAELRSWLELSQEGMARLMSCSFASVNRWEKGHSSPTGTVLEVYRALDMAQKAGVSAAQVLGDEPASPGATLHRIFQVAYGGRK